MPEGGNLTVETENVMVEQGASDHIEGLAPGSYVRLSVSDTGEGMPPEVQSRAFDPFFTTKRAGSGTGLGLSMVYGFAKQSGGQAAIRSTLGQGTSVEVYLPEAAHGGSETPRVESDAKAMRGGTERILLVEDDSRVRHVTLQRLEALGYRVVAAPNGAYALEILQEGDRFDLLFTDMLMPGAINGGELARRARDVDPGIKVLFTSGYADPEAHEAVRLLSDVNFFAKALRALDSGPQDPPVSRRLNLPAGSRWKS